MQGKFGAILMTTLDNDAERNAADNAADPAIESPAAKAAAVEADKIEAAMPEASEDAAEAAEEVEDTRTPQQIAIDEFKEIASVVGIALVLVLVLRTFLFQPFTIPSASMEPNLYQGDYIIVSKWDYGYSKHSILFSPPLFSGRVFDHQPTRGDIIVFKLPSDNKTDYIKRVVGLPGDTLQMKNDQLYINDKLVPNAVLGDVPAEDAVRISGQETATLLREELPGGRTHLMQDMVQDGPVDNTDVYTVPEGHYFMMGDNRDNSEDSRFPMVTGGVDYVPAENLEGRAVLVLMSWKEGSSLWKPWTWLNFHWDRFFKSLH